MGGRDVATIQPPFSILPKKEGVNDVSTQDVVIKNIPFDYAIPMLTGWEVGYWTDDQHVKDLGVWIDEWSYSVGATGGTLRYKLSSILRDDDGPRTIMSTTRSLSWEFDRLVPLHGSRLSRSLPRRLDRDQALSWRSRMSEMGQELKLSPIRANVATRDEVANKDDPLIAWTIAINKVTGDFGLAMLAATEKAIMFGDSITHGKCVRD
jgi:hypothetical protein